VPDLGTYENIVVTLDGHVACVELNRPPHNFLDHLLVRDLADAFELLDKTVQCRAIVLAAAGKSFCAGGSFANPKADAETAPPAVQSQAPGSNPTYIEAVRLFRCAKPVVAAVHGPAVGAGLGLTMVADFRVACSEARFVANFTKLGFHPGFGLTVTLPEAIGKTNANFMFMTSRRFKGEEAKELGLVNLLVSQDRVRAAAFELAEEIAQCSPLGTWETRKTMRGGLADRVKTATDHELTVQAMLRQTQDYREGVDAVKSRRTPVFPGV
jgi:enoyl-CoA hydratase/carnithine racemase